MIQAINTLMDLNSSGDFISSHPFITILIKEGNAGKRKMDFMTLKSRKS